MTPAFRRKLVEWYATNARDLPWRVKPTPYRVWISEIMLQQTRVETVREYFQRFMKRFPSVRKLAGADTETVLQAWSGLGYYRRARMLHTAAQQITELHGGRIPFHPAALLKLPGIGRYTCGAILSIAFNQPQAIVDGNIERVFARLTALGEGIKSPDAQKTIWQLATDHVERGFKEGHAPSDLNQALMELGATVCTPTNPRCDACPVGRHCNAKREANVHKFPIKAQRKKAQELRYVFVALQDSKGRILLTRREQSDKTSLLPGGMWELPHSVDTQEVAERFAAQGPLSSLGEVRHAIMNYRLTLDLRAGKTATTVRSSANRRWFTCQEALNSAIAGATRKLLRKLP